MTIPPNPLDLTIGKYQILELAGEGAMGAVYRARDTVLNRTVAIKVMNATIARDTELRDRFLREAQSAGSLQHPNVVTVFDFGEVDGHLFIAMEYVDGVDLGTLLARPLGVTLQVRLEIMIDVLAGLEYAHQHGIVHRDLKPANIQVTSAQRAKLMDFGVAHLESSEMTRTGMLVGTPNYMAPEYISGNPVTASSDVYSMGAVLYEVLTGRKPFEGETLHALLFKIVGDEPAAPSSLVPSLPKALDAIVAKAMAKEPSARYETALHMAHALTAVRASLSGTPYNESQALSTTLAHMVASQGGHAAREAAERTEGVRESAARAHAAAAPVAVAVPTANPWSLKLAVGGATALVVVAALFVALRYRNPTAAAVPSALPTTNSANTAVIAQASAAPASSPTPTPERLAPAPAAARPTNAGPLSAAANSAATAVPRTRSPSISVAPLPGAVAPVAAPPVATPPATAASVSMSPVVAPTMSPTVAAPTSAAPTVAAPTSAAPVTTDPVPARSAQLELGDLIARYARAISARDLGAIRAVYPDMTREQQQGFERFFSSTKALRATLALGALDVRDAAADGAVSGTYEFTTSAGRTERQPVTFRATFERHADKWRLVGVR